MPHKIALFFDNDEQNLLTSRDKCPNVIPIKVPSEPATNDSTLKVGRFITYYNSLDEGSRRFYICLKNAIITKYSVTVEQVIEDFHINSGINSTLMNNTVSALTDKSFKSKYNIASCIFNINATIIKNNGFMNFSEQLSITRIRKLIQEVGSMPTYRTFTPIDYKKDLESADDLNNIISNTNIRSEMDKITDKDIANCFLGGNKRASELVSFFKKLKSEKINFIFTTNDDSYCPEVNGDCTKYTGEEIEYIKNRNYNELFFNILVAVGIIDNNFNIFMSNMMIYNNSDLGTIYDRIKKTLLYEYYSYGEHVRYSRPVGHLITESCERTLEDEMAQATVEVQSFILSERVKQKGFFKSLFGKGRGRGRKTMKKRKTKRQTKKTKRY